MITWRDLFRALFVASMLALMFALSAIADSPLWTEIWNRRP